MHAELRREGQLSKMNFSFILYELIRMDGLLIQIKPCQNTPLSSLC